MNRSQQDLPRVALNGDRVHVPIEPHRGVGIVWGRKQSGLVIVEWPAPDGVSTYRDYHEPIDLEIIEP